MCCGLHSLRVWNQIKCPGQGLHLCVMPLQSLPVMVGRSHIKGSPQGPWGPGQGGGGCWGLCSTWRVLVGGQGVQGEGCAGATFPMDLPSCRDAALSLCPQGQTPCRSSHPISRAPFHCSHSKLWGYSHNSPALPKIRFSSTLSLSLKHLFSLSVAGWDQVQQVLSSTVRPSTRQANQPR